MMELATAGAEPSIRLVILQVMEDTVVPIRRIIDILRKNKRMLSDSQLSHLLKSHDEAIRFCGISYIRGMLDSLHLDAIPPLSKDPNVGIVALCDEILKMFSDILSKNESKSFKKQEAAKASANGF